MEMSSKDWDKVVAREVAQFNNSSFTDAVTDCDICHGKGLYAVKRAANGTSSKAIGQCGCMELVKQQDKLRLCGMPELMSRCAFHNFTVTAPWQRELLETVKACLATESWLLLCGQSGCGKTHLAAALCRELLLQGRSVLCISWPETVRKLLSAGYEREGLLRPLESAPVLFVDDLFKTGADGKREVSRQELELAFSLIEHRSRKQKRTIITTELLTAQLKQLSEGLLGRILERCGKFVKNISRREDRNHRIKTA